MNLLIKKELLLQGIGIVEHIIGKNLTLPVLNNILIKTNNNNLNLITTDLELAISLNIPAKIESEGSITIPPKTINTFLNNLPEGNIELNIKNKNLYLKQNNFKASFKGEDTNDYPLLPKVDKENPLIIPASKIISAFNQVINSSSNSDIKPELTGVFFYLKGNELKLASTDGFRLSEKSLQQENNQTTDKKIIIPAKAIQEISRVYQNKDDDLYFYINKNQLVVENKENKSFHIQFITKLIEGEYPEYLQIIPQSFTTTTIISKKTFIQQIKSASLFASRLNDVKLKIQSKKIEISSNDYDIGDFTSSIEASTEGEDKEITLNYQYLLDGLQNIDGDEVMISLNQKEQPILLRSTKQKNYFYVLMPIRGN